MADTATLAAPTVAERVAAGAAWLDRRQSGWWRKDADRAIDLDGLGMEHCNFCVLGQLYGSYYAVEISLDQAVDMGFDASRGTDGVNWDDFESLRAEWTRVITERREAAREVAGDGA